MVKVKSIMVKGLEISTFYTRQSEFISLTDIARHKESSNTDDVVKNWMRSRNTLELLGFWEILNNPNFKPVEFDGFKKQAGIDSFVIKPKKWILIIEIGIVLYKVIDLIT